MGVIQGNQRANARSARTGQRWAAWGRVVAIWTKTDLPESSPMNGKLTTPETKRKPVPVGEVWPRSRPVRGGRGLSDDKLTMVSTASSCRILMRNCPTRPAGRWY